VLPEQPVSSPPNPPATFVSKVSDVPKRQNFDTLPVKFRVSSASQLGKFIR
jgi:hypothetical protein